MTDAASGVNPVAGTPGSVGMAALRSVDARTGEAFGPPYREATAEEVAATTAGAAEAFLTWGESEPADRAATLRGVADELEALGDSLLDLADRETGLGHERLESERARTCGQLRFFADILEEGSFVEAVIDRDDASPARPDVRRVLVPLGPVAVFGASNFPLAFSVPGGDTAAALAAGCPVVVKAHPSHPGTSELSAQAIVRALHAGGWPAETFSMLQGAGNEVGEWLVTAPEVRAVGFTGSFRGGRSLHDLAARRPEPIPVYAEMGSLNPIVVTPGALVARGGEIADGFASSMTLGTGQFCTKPGLVFIPEGDADRFAEEVAASLRASTLGPMLNGGLREAVATQVATTAALDAVTVVSGGEGPAEAGRSFPPTLLRVGARDLTEQPALLEEHFGPVAVLVTYDGPRTALDALEQLPGSLTASVHAEPDEADLVRELVALLRAKAGRLVWNGYPTGVVVSHAMHHGGPFPATTDPLHTSVGATAIRRFLRPVAYQDYPDHLLPAALQDANPLGIQRHVAGRWTDRPLDDGEENRP